MSKGKFIINTLAGKTKKEGITLVITASKIQALPFFFESLKKMDLPREGMHLLIYDNTDDENFLEILRSELDEFMCPKCRQFKSVRLYKSYLPPKGVLYGVGNENFQFTRLSSIWHMWNKIKGMIYTDCFFQLEDDTLVQPNAFRRLWALLEANPKAGFITAIETGRNALPYLPVRLGVHKVIVKKGWLWRRESFPPETTGVHEIDASGVYCFVARTEAWKSAFKDYDPVSKLFSQFAMDNVLTYNMKKHGWKLLADFDIWCGHLQVSFGRICIFTPEQALQFADIWIPEYNSYAISVEVKKPGQKFRKQLLSKPAPCFNLHPDEDEGAEEIIKKINKEEKSKK